MDLLVLGIIGCGAIGSDVAIAADNMERIGSIFLYDIKLEKAENLNKRLSKGFVEKFDTFLPKVDIVFEAASYGAVRQYAEKVIEAGKDLIIMSIGGLLDEDLYNRLRKKAEQMRSKIYLPSGAVCGIDGLKAAQASEVNEVTLVTTKTPASLGKDLDKRTIIF